jgi:lysozyme
MKLKYDLQEVDWKCFYLPGLSFFLGDKTASRPEEEAAAERLPQEAVSLIKEYEGLRLNAYRDGPNRWAIGYGTESFEGETITHREAERRLLRELGPLNLLISSRCVLCNRGQKSALLSFAFNVGRGALLRSRLWRLTLEGNYVTAADEFRRWTYHNGKHYRGLALRREAERAVYLMGD